MSGICHGTLVDVRTSIQNSTPDELRAYLDGFREACKIGSLLGKLSVRTGTNYGLVMMSVETLLKEKIDFLRWRVLNGKNNATVPQAPDKLLFLILILLAEQTEALSYSLIRVVTTDILLVKQFFLKYDTTVLTVSKP